MSVESAKHAEHFSNDIYEQLLSAWITGDATQQFSNKLPESWQAFLHQIEPEKHNLALLCLATQFQEFAITGEPCGTLSGASALPKLDLPLMGGELRPLFRRTLEQANKRGFSTVNRLLQLVAERQVCVHPADWLPAPDNTEFPELYWPWFNWRLQLEQQQVDSGERDQLSEASWSSFYPAQRIQMLKILRHTEPQRARQLLETCALQEPAEKRLNLMKTLSINLQADDKPLLRQLTQDRSKKVSIFASQLLSQLGDVDESMKAPDTENTTLELAQWYERKKQGLIKRKTWIEPKKLKNKKQQSMRTEALLNVPLRDFARSLEMSLQEFLRAWHFPVNRESDNLQLLHNIANTLPAQYLPDVVTSLREQMADDPECLALISVLLPRLSYPQRTELMLSLMTNTQLQMSFTSALQFVASPLSSLQFDELSQFQAWRDLLQEIRVADLQGGYLESGPVFLELQSLALLLPPITATLATQVLLSMGLHAADPALDMLNLNQKLNNVESQ